MVAELDRDARAGDCEVAVTAGHFLNGEATPALPDREPHTAEDLVVGEGGRPGAGEESGSGNLPAATR